MQENVCRICLLYLEKDHSCVRLLESNLIMDIYQNFTGIQVEALDAVQTICIDCASQLEAFNVFRAKCIRSDAFLKIKVDTNPRNDEIKIENVETFEHDHGEANNEALSPLEEVQGEVQAKIPCNEFVLDNCVKQYPCLKHEKKHELKKSVFCELCGVRLSSARAFKAHKLYKHSDHRPFSCTQCASTFKSKSGLKDHNAVRHNKERKFVCDICTWTSKTLKTLKRHILQVHLTEKTVPCNICLVKFKNKKTLDQHFLTHTDFRPFVCDKCSRGFAQISSLSKHIKICGKQGKIRSQPIKCGDCIKRLASTKTLVSHRLKCHKELYRNWKAASTGIKFAEPGAK